MLVPASHLLKSSRHMLAELWDALGGEIVYEEKSIPIPEFGVL